MPSFMDLVYEATRRSLSPENASIEILGALAPCIEGRRVTVPLRLSIPLQSLPLHVRFLTRMVVIPGGQQHGATYIRGLNQERELVARLRMPFTDPAEQLAA